MLVALEQEGDALGVGLEAALAVGGIDGAVQRLVRLDQCRRHGDRIVEVGECAVGEGGAGVEHTLGGGFDGLALLVAGGVGPWEVVVDDVFGVAEVALQTAAG